MRSKTDGRRRRRENVGVSFIELMCFLCRFASNHQVAKRNLHSSRASVRRMRPAAESDNVVGIRYGTSLVRRGIDQDVPPCDIAHDASINGPEATSARMRRMKETRRECPRNLQNGMALTIVDHPVMICRSGPRESQKLTSRMSFVTVALVLEEHSCGTGALPGGRVSQLDRLDRPDSRLHEVLRGVTTQLGIWIRMLTLTAASVTSAGRLLMIIFAAPAVNAFGTAAGGGTAFGTFVA